MTSRRSAFAGYHPWVNLLYFAAVLGVTMFSMSPVFLVLTVAASTAYLVQLLGRAAWRRLAAVFVPLLAFMALVNPLFNHRGVTVLFYLSGNAITLEAIVYGVAAALMLTAALCWFICFTHIFTPDKLIFLFGRVAPVVALLCSICLRFVPLLIDRYRQITTAQQGLGRASDKGPLAQFRQALRKLSVLVSWSLEASIETSASMEARGYGLQGRTSFHLYRFTRRDAALFGLVLLLLGLTCLGIGTGINQTAYYPELTLPPLSPWSLLFVAAYATLLLLPCILDKEEQRKWISYRSKI